MWLLLNWRLWVAVALAAALAASHLTAYRKGKHVVQASWTASVASANEEARHLEAQRQRRADDASRLAATREDSLRRDAGAAGSALGGLRDAIAARDAIQQSCTAAIERATARGKLLVESAEALTEVAGRCDRHVNDLRLYIDAWPK